MKTYLILSLLLIFCLGSISNRLLASNNHAQIGSQTEAVKQHFEMGNDVAQSISTVTGISISPLFAVSGLGAYKYFKAPPEERAFLPWYSSPYVWGIGMLIVLLFALNSTIGSAVPVLKKPMDVVELYENKASLLLASPAVAVEAINVYSKISVVSNTAPELSSPSLLMADSLFLSNIFDGSWVGYIIAIPIFMWAFLVIWMAFHAINVLIMLSPFGLLDLILRGFKIGILCLIIISSWVNPYLGAVVSVLILVVSYFIAGWSFRLSVFGAIFSWDILAFKQKRCNVTPDSLWVFTSKKLKKAPIRTYGRLAYDRGNNLCLLYRPFLIMPLRSLHLPTGNYTLRRGSLSPAIICEDQKQQKQYTLLRFPPRYRSHENDLAATLRISNVEDSKVVKGFNAAVQWTKEMIGGVTSKLAEVKAARGAVS